MDLSVFEWIGIITLVVTVITCLVAGATYLFGSPGRALLWRASFSKLVSIKNTHYGSRLKISLDDKPIEEELWLIDFRFWPRFRPITRDHYNESIEARVFFKDELVEIIEAEVEHKNEAVNTGFIYLDKDRQEVHKPKSPDEQGIYGIKINDTPYNFHMRGSDYLNLTLLVRTKAKESIDLTPEALGHIKGGSIKRSSGSRSLALLMLLAEASILFAFVVLLISGGSEGMGSVVQVVLLSLASVATALVFLENVIAYKSKFEE